MAVLARATELLLKENVQPLFLKLYAHPCMEVGGLVYKALVYASLPRGLHAGRREVGKRGISFGPPQPPAPPIGKNYVYYNHVPYRLKF